MSLLNLLGSIAKNAVSAQALATLRRECPPSLRDSLETLLGDSVAVSCIEKLVGRALKDASAFTPESLLGLPLPEASKTLLEKTPELVSFLAETIGKRLPSAR